ncbi:peptidoglycan-binding domain-containing protein [Aeromicrobium choanae]|uniref:Peptidoglycan-binding (PGRP) domain of peptidoglycan hydrolases-containing protein n=1 Tax=Aeromicrobium choanae TaxID=1736691 RepID=A0A1T4YQ08_9ACTN|nr:peptidoglycan-binding domain-containing protein [Aeromicrobium choanae]SKB03917.1 Peptidoglycan-binding (PGRP) domain of peptidoglycan hydrolases-containing protein [Aeromicrobium choanae]
MLTLAGCGEGDGDDPVKAAEARVQAKEKALADAKAEFAEQSEEFCDASEDYITSLDRYGDVLTETTTTVGDVRDAGAELEQPRAEAMDGAEAAVDAQRAVADARQELAEAEAALAVAKDPSAKTTAPASSSPDPLAPAATVDRVEQAESQFATAQEGITDATPLAQASEQFNAAAVALELSWLRLFADAGCLTDEQAVQAESAVREYTTTLQRSLSEAGHFDGEVDGVYGPATVDAVKALQEASGLPVTGVVDKATAAALQADLAAQGGASAQEDTASTAALQQTLRLAGFWDGPVDGEWTPELTEALEDFQDELDVEPTGTVDAATITALEKAIAEAQEADEESPGRTSATASPSASPPSD